ncbi:hypothetical protein [Actinocorallia longicatena]|uniref:Uncharacterized protein n=1 Tax=Actinocorallia longicatena TaxID=111803 RepID=A0ABP6QHQ9_9ACTN
MRTTLPGLLLLSALAGCGGLGTPAGTVAPSRGHVTEPPAALELSTRMARLGAAEDLIYLIDLEGVTRTAQTSLPEGGYQAVYTEGGIAFTLTVERRDLTADECPSLPIPDAGGPVRCVPTTTGFYRRGGGRHEIVLSRDGFIVRLGGPRTVPRTRLRSLAFAAHHASAEEFDALLPPR